MNFGAEQRKLAAIMFTDMVGFSALAQHNEKHALELLQEHRALLRPLFPRFNGVEIKTIGDAFLVEFGSALEAAQCAIEIQRSLAKRNTDAPADRQIQVRIGIHIGDVVHRGGDVYGDGVNIASRIEPLAGAGGICVSVDVERQIRSAIEVSLVRLAPTELKNIRTPMELFRVVLPWEGRGVSGSARVPALRVSVGARPLAIGVAALLLLGLAGAGIGYWAKRGEPKATVAAPGRAEAVRPEPPADRHRIAMLPLANLSSDPENEYFAKQMTEQLTAKLWHISGLTVIPVTSSNYAAKEPAEIGRGLRVRAVLRGSVSKAGDQLNIVANLFDVGGQVLWATNFEKEFKEVFAIQREVAEGVAEALRMQLTATDREKIEKRPTDNLEAYNLYLRGRFYNDQWSKEGFDAAINQLERAVHLDPKFAQAFTSLAEAHIGTLYFKTLSREGLPQARAAVLKALEIDPMLPQAHAALGLVKVLNWELRDAEQDYTKALALSPRDPFIRDGYAWLLASCSRMDQAQAEMQRALQLDPLSPLINIDLTWMFLFARQYQKAVDQAEDAIKLDPSNVSAYEVLGRAYGHTGKFARASSAFEEAKRLSPDSALYGVQFAWIYTLSGKRYEALKIVHDMEQHPNLFPRTKEDIAWIYTELGDLDRAFKWLDEAYEEKSPGFLYIQVEPAWDNLRRDPRYAALLKRMGFD